MVHSCRRLEHDLKIIATGFFEVSFADARLVYGLLSGAEWLKVGWLGPGRTRIRPARAHGKPGMSGEDVMNQCAEDETLVILKPDTVWRGLEAEVEGRLKGLGLRVVAQGRLAGDRNLPAERWREFYFPAIGNKPAVILGTANYMAHGPVKVIHFQGEQAVPRVRQLVGDTRPWQAAAGTIRGDLWAGAEAANAAHRLKFQQPGDDQFLFNLVHASDSRESFLREIAFFAGRLA